MVQVIDVVFVLITSQLQSRPRLTEEASFQLLGLKRASLIPIERVAGGHFVTHFVHPLVVLVP